MKEKAAIIFLLLMIPAYVMGGETAGDYINKAVEKSALHDYRGAIKDCNKAIELDPKNADAYNNRSIAKACLKDWEGAYKDY
ncbi:MAG: tetratricopeptide repeat protein, partial [Proteobacteria bacterium]|nr:tetratricopeptide repeat protein [Pseudomonadota bacterium]